MTATLIQAISEFGPNLPLAVAYSGGADSTALLLACSEKWPGQVHAVHIHHGLQAGADAFSEHCQAYCGQLGVPLTVRMVNGRHQPGQSPEDAARRARYKAFEDLALDQYASPAIKTIALGQHADDQVETLILALSRGAGLPGISAMRSVWSRNGITYHRPLLRVGGADTRAWLELRGVAFIEDPTNMDEQFTRNRIRAQIMPTLAAALPAFRDTFARSAAHAAQAQAVLEEIAAQDMALVGQPPEIASLQRLSRGRQANVLRHWLRRGFDSVPSAAQMTELLDQIAACVTRGHGIELKVGTGFVQRKGAALHWYNSQVLL